MTLTISPPPSQNSERTKQLLITLSRIIALNQTGFVPSLLLAHPSYAKAVTNGWSLSIEENGQELPHFGQYANCHAAARCAGCEHICPAEEGLAALSRATGGLPVLRASIVQEPGCPVSIDVHTFVPDHPLASGAWTAMLCSQRHQFVLVSPDQNRSAVVHPGGHLAILHRAIPDRKLAEGRAALSLLWKLHFSGVTETANLGQSVSGEVAC